MAVPNCVLNAGSNADKKDDCVYFLVTFFLNTKAKNETIGVFLHRKHQ